MTAPMLVSVKVAALLAVLIAALTVLASATAATPAGYRAHVNAICAVYTPAAKQLGRELSAAVTAKDGQAYGRALGKVITLQLAEDGKVEAVAVPAALAATMRPILARMRQLDTHMRNVLAAARAGNDARLMAELTQVSQLGKPLNRWLDAAGLRECGTKQS